MRQKVLLATLLFLICGVLGTLALRLGPCERLELKTLDARFRLFPQPQRASKEVVIVEIDDKSLAEFRRHGVAWPWPRSHYARLVRLLARGGAKAIVFDELFSEPGAGDQDFASAIREAGNVVLSAEFTRHSGQTFADNPLSRPPSLKVRFAGSPPGQYRFAILPQPLFQKSAAALGVADYQLDEDEIVRRQPLFFGFAGKVFPQAALAAYLTARGIDSVELPSPGLLAAGRDLIPLDAGGLRIFWYGPERKGFRHYSFSELVPPAPGAGSPAQSDTFRDKVVIVGLAASGPFENCLTPYTRDVRSSLCEVLATMTSDLLQKDFLLHVRAAVPVSAGFLFAALVCGLFFFGPGLLPVTAATIACVCAWLALAVWLFVSRGLWLDVVAPLAALGLAFAAAAAVSYQVEGKARRRLRSVFNRYVSPVVVSQILERRENLELGGQEVTGTAFFSDLKDFTALSEKLPAREVVAFLNEYFSLASAAILENGGLIDKYIGDAIMAVFGAPIPSRTHAAQACAAALELRFHLAAAGRPAWATRIGIHSGPMVVGNIGSPQRLDYTAIGDTVNLASRLEGANKLYGTSLLVSEAVVREAGDGFESRELDLLAVKGRRQVLRVYELLGRQGEVTKELRACKQRFEAGLGWYRDRDFAKALDTFEALLAARPDDGPALLYVQRCRTFLGEPPAPDWDGGHHLTSK